MALSSSQRLAVSTCHSNSGVANPMRASRSARPVFIARDASARFCASERTSRTTVFIIPPRHIGIEVSHQLIRRRELIGRFAGADMSVITLASLAVVSQHTLAGNDIGEPVFELVRRRRHRLVNAPHSDLDERIGRKHTCDADAESNATGYAAA